MRAFTIFVTLAVVAATVSAGNYSCALDPGTPFVQNAYARRETALESFAALMALTRPWLFSLAGAHWMRPRAPRQVRSVARVVSFVSRRSRCAAIPRVPV